MSLPQISAHSCGAAGTVASVWLGSSVSLYDLSADCGQSLASLLPATPTGRKEEIVAHPWKFNNYSDSNIISCIQLIQRQCKYTSWYTRKNAIIHMNGPRQRWEKHSKLCVGPTVTLPFSLSHSYPLSVIFFTEIHLSILANSSILPFWSLHSMFTCYTLTMLH